MTSATTSMRLLAGALGLLLAATLGVTHAAAQESFSIQIAPATEGNTAVRGGQRITVSGQAPSGAIESARLLAVHVDGTQSVQSVPDNVLNRTPDPLLDDDDYLRSDGGELDGRLTLGCLFSSPTTACFHPETRGVILEITVADQAVESNSLRVDHVRPQLHHDRELVAPDRVLVRFTEPVRQPEGEIGGDWRVDGVSPLAVERSSRGRPDCIYEPGEDSSAGETGCARILQLAEPLDEDATPEVEYWLVGYNVPRRSEHIDYAGNQVLFTGARPRIADALDLIRPAKPNIESVDGRTGSGGEVRSNTSAPTVRLTNVTAGHTARVEATGPGIATAYQATVPPNSNTVDVPIPSLPGDGSYTFTASAIDPNGNTSEDTDKTGPRADGARQTVRYILDSVVPEPLAATMLTRRSVEVIFTETILPAGNAGRWFVGDTPVTAEGSGDRRTLRSATDLHAPAGGELMVRWEPTSESSEPGTTGRYGDGSGNGVDAFQLPLSDLPAIPAPGITAPAEELYTNAGSVTISGTAPAQPNLVAELFDRGADQPRSTADVANGRWSFDEPLGADGRYEFDVRLRDTQTETSSQRVAVPDVVRDTTDPVVDVLRPDPRPLSLDNPLETRREYGVGSSVEIRWTATDEAPNDPERADHGQFATIYLVGSDDDSRRVIADNIPHQPGQEQSRSYTLTQADLAGQGSRELRFEVAVTDLATNQGDDASAPILLLADLIGFAPALTQLTRIDVRFPVALEGETFPGEWLVAGTPAQQAQKLSQDGNTVVRLTTGLNDDPNWTPQIEYQPLALNPTQLRSSGGTPIARQGSTVDELAPALEVEAPNVGSRPIDADSVPFSGTTDASPARNTVFAYRTDASGALQGAPVASTTAGTDGQWQMDVPLAQNAVNRIVIRASDPSGNVSATLPDPVFSVVEDSLAPVVQITSPTTASLVPPVLDITWQTIEANKESVRIDYRIGDEAWTPIADRINDTGSYRWEIPEHVKPEIFSLRVTATDQTAKTGTATVDGLRLDLEAPTILKARASGAQVVDVTFSEPVTVDGSGFTIGGATVRRMKGDGLKRTFILNRALDSTTPQVEYSGTSVTDLAGNEMEATSLRATRSFAFAVTGLRGQRVTPNRARVAWTDARNRPGDLRGYRIYRDGTPIALVGSATKSYTDAKGKGRHVYSVRAVDDRRRVSSVRRVVVRR